MERFSLFVSSPRLALIGYRCTGKTTVARILSERWGWEAEDLDILLERRARSSISDFVRREGWPAFRELETELLKEQADREHLVLSTGGGIVETAAARECLKKRFFTVWLEARPETIAKRMKEDPDSAVRRPPLTSYSLLEEIRTVLSKRNPWYRECAHLVLSTDDRTSRRVASEIEQTWRRGGAAGCEHTRREDPCR